MIKPGSDVNERNKNRYNPERQRACVCAKCASGRVHESVYKFVSGPYVLDRAINGVIQANVTLKSETE